MDLIMQLKWFFWKYIVRNAAKRHGFLDPIEILSRLQNFAQPAEVAAPVELLRAGVVFHARGLINSQAIQHNLDWIWPYWVECQFDPLNEAFIPRAFSITHVNLTHRNWTALGVPDTQQWPIVDPKGLVTPFFDSWSIDSWIIPEKGQPLLPSRCQNSSQKLIFDNSLALITETRDRQSSITSKVEVDFDKENLCCRLNIKGQSSAKGWLVVALRPYNPEGISFIHEIEQLKKQEGWKVNGKQHIVFDQLPDKYLLSSYKEGDVYRFLKDQTLHKQKEKTHIKCKVGMVTAAALFPLQADVMQEINVHIPLTREKYFSDKSKKIHSWEKSLEGHCQLNIQDERFQFLYDAAIRTLVLLSPEEVYPGPYTYRRFWFRDAAFILYAMLCAGFDERVKRVLNGFPEKQTPLGYFLSQDGEWDSNGEALWILSKYCELTGKNPEPKWKSSIVKGAKWILRKRLSNNLKTPHSGLFPPGFSAEHLGPNDYYYWDDFWGVAGLNAASYLTGLLGDSVYAKRYAEESKEFMGCIERSLNHTRKFLGRLAIPAAPYRRLDAGAIGSIVSGYPLQLLSKEDPRLIDTIDFLLKDCLVNGGFFQDMTHSGINPYLTLHIAQILLRAGDPRYFELMRAVAGLATSTGQWPEAVHPRTKGGCMGDGQHVWAAAEWVMMVRNCFVREEAAERKIILCSGVPAHWLSTDKEISFGPTLTSFGPVSLVIKVDHDFLNVEWSAKWYKEEPIIEVCFPGMERIAPSKGKGSVQLKRIIR